VSTKAPFAYAEPTRVPPEKLAAGARIAERFEVLGLIGRGGMAEVYRVRDQSGGRELALKRLLAQRSGQKLALALFEREYHTLAQLTHPCVIRVHDYGVTDDGAYYTMELLDGTDLRQTGKLEWRRACEVLRDVASALAVVHARRWLHRDPSPRNVMCRVEGGTAKLIDFGAMAPIGITRGVVGTPPLVPPEALQQQALDVRADLYALGALAYWLLTGRHAYPALRFDELPDLWRSVPRAPDKLEPGVPAALGSLILELLSFDRAARPACAANVIERLGGLLGDNRPLSAAVSAAYLAIPKLVGRERPLMQARKQLLKTLRGKGSALLIESEAGAGRSRFLDACVLDAKILGATVLRGDPSDGARGDYGVATAIGEQLLRAHGELATNAARLQRSLLGRVLPSLEVGPALTGPAPERRHVQAALRDWFRAVSRSRGLVLAIDDFERIDEPSAALIASLVHRNERRKLVVLASARSDATHQPALELLRASSLRIELDLLTLEESTSLLESVFDNAHGVHSFAHRLHDLAQGNPLRLMQLAEHVVSHGHARYLAGSWVVAESLPAAALPESLDAALLERYRSLPADACELAQVLALTDAVSIPLHDYPLLISHRDHPRTFAALDQLRVAGVLASQAERYRFTHERWPALIGATLDRVRSRELHARLADIVDPQNEPIRSAYHRMASGRELEAIELLLGALRNPDLLFSEALLGLLERAVAASTQLVIPARTRLELRAWLVQIAAVLAKLEPFAAHARAVIDELDRISGVFDWRAAHDAPPEQRLLLAMAAAQQRHDAEPDPASTHSPIEAFILLAQVSGACASLAQGVLDPIWLEHVPSLAAFVPLSPAVWVAETLTEAVRATQAGQWDRAYQLGDAVLARLEQPDHGGLPETAYDRTRNAVLLGQSDYEAFRGHPGVVERLGELLDTPGYRADAWEKRGAFERSQGNVAEARRCARRADLMLLQDGTMQFGMGRGLVTEAWSCWFSDDLDGIKQLIPRLETMARPYPGWRVVASLNQAHYLRVRGDGAGALKLVESLLPLATPGQHRLCVSVAAVRVALLCATGRAAEAAQIGAATMLEMAAQQLGAQDCRELNLATAEALALSGSIEPAIELAERELQALEREGCSGLLVGCAREIQAKIALAMRDQQRFQYWLELSRQSMKGDNPAWGAKLGRLRQEARRLGLSGDETFAEAPHSAVAEGGDTSPGDATELSRMQECVNLGERARCGLSMLLEDTRRKSGYLFGLLEGRFALLAAVPDEAASEAPLEAAEEYVRGQIQSIQTTAVTRARRDERDATPATHSTLTTDHEAILVRGSQESDALIAAVAVFPRERAKRKPPTKLLAIVADSLLTHDDVDPIL
jgi:hypothetical protein